jgi:hypothetical protein
MDFDRLPFRVIRLYPRWVSPSACLCALLLLKNKGWQLILGSSTGTEWLRVSRNMVRDELQHWLVFFCLKLALKSQPCNPPATLPRRRHRRSVQDKHLYKENAETLNVLLRQGSAERPGFTNQSGLPAANVEGLFRYFANQS